MASENEGIGVLNDPDDFASDQVVNFYEVTVDIPSYCIRVYAETAEDAEDMVLDHLHETFSFADLLMDADTITEEIK